MALSRLVAEDLRDEISVFFRNLLNGFPTSIEEIRRNTADLLDNADITPDAKDLHNLLYCCARYGIDSRNPDVLLNIQKAIKPYFKYWQELSMDAMKAGKVMPRHFVTPLWSMSVLGLEPSPQYMHQWFKTASDMIGDGNMKEGADFSIPMKVLVQKGRPIPQEFFNTWQKGFTKLVNDSLQKRQNGYHCDKVDLQAIGDVLWTIGQAEKKVDRNLLKAADALALELLKETVSAEKVSTASITIPEAYRDDEHSRKGKFHPAHVITLLEGYAAQSIVPSNKMLGLINTIVSRALVAGSLTLDDQINYIVALADLGQTPPESALKRIRSNLSHGMTSNELSIKDLALSSRAFAIFTVLSPEFDTKGPDKSNARYVSCAVRAAEQRSETFEQDNIGVPSIQMLYDAALLFSIPTKFSAPAETRRKSPSECKMRDQFSEAAPAANYRIQKEGKYFERMAHHIDITARAMDSEAYIQEIHVEYDGTLHLVRIIDPRTGFLKPCSYNGGTALQTALIKREMSEQEVLIRVPYRLGDVLKAMDPQDRDIVLFDIIEKASSRPIGRTLIMSFSKADELSEDSSADGFFVKLRPFPMGKKGRPIGPRIEPEPAVAEAISAQPLLA